MQKNMEEQDSKNKGANASDYLANERTFLAWIRTSIAIMGFGFVVVKFSLFIKQLSFVLGKSMGQPGKGYSSDIGILLVAFGSVMALLAFVRYRNIQKQLSKHSYFPSILLSVLLTVFIVIISLILIIYLVPNI